MTNNNNMFNIGEWSEISLMYSTLYQPSQEPARTTLRELVYAVFFVFSITFFVIYLLDLYPEVRIANADTVVAEEVELANTPNGAKVSSSSALDVRTAVPEDSGLPHRIVISKINVDVAVLNPTSSKISVLDQALLSGAARYPTSSTLAENGNILIFGHSSSRAVVRNQNFKAFNRVSELVEGDTIRVFSKDREYVFRVDTVVSVKAEDGVVYLEPGIKKLTIVTCNSFGDKSDRFMVEASFVGSYPL